MKNGYHLVEDYSTAKFPITDPPPPPRPKAWVFTFLNVNGNGKLASAIMKNWLLFHRKPSYSKISNYQSPKVWVPAFPSVNGNGISHL